MLKFSEKSTANEIEYTSVAYDIDLPAPSPSPMAKRILGDVLRSKRFAGNAADCDDLSCPKCLAPHLSKVISAVALGLPVTFVLPAFPGKSPNAGKVLGPLPDMAEWQALSFLQKICDRIKNYYSAGARVILCSDGRVFSDVVGMRDEDVTRYQDELSRMIDDSGFSAISTFNLDELYEGLSFDEMRSLLMEQHGDPLEVLRLAVSRGSKEVDCSAEDRETHRLYCGITRFLLEDSTFPGQKKTRTALQKECRMRAYEVIQRSKAWGEFVELRFPNAVRLSIHPQTCGDKKLGIRLIEPDQWMTPWHAVAVAVDGKFTLMKRAKAEELGGRLIYKNGRPSHFSLTSHAELPEQEYA